MTLELILTPLSSFMFVKIPDVVSMPNRVRNSFYFLALASSLYHLNEKLQEEEWLICNNIEDDDIVRHRLSTFLLYSFFKYYYNDETMKRIVFVSSAIWMIRRTPRIILPLTISGVSYNYYTQTYKWSMGLRWIWHISNAIYAIWSLKIFDHYEYKIIS